MFGEGATRIQGHAVMGREIYFATYQSLKNSTDAESTFEGYPPDFFDVVIVDECHRGSVPGSSWRAVLDRFTSAVHLGLTATPKRDENVDTYDYFGEPVFEYSLRQGIEDGYLAPYTVRRVVLTPDAEGWRPEPGEVDTFGRDIPDGLYTTRDFERLVSLLRRTDAAARHLSQVFQDRPGRAVVFCVDSEHAEQMRQALVAHNPTERGRPIRSGWSGSSAPKARPAGASSTGSATRSRRRPSSPRHRGCCPPASTSRT